MSKVIVEKNKPKFDPIELNITIQITTMEDFIEFKNDIEDVLEGWDFDSPIVDDLITQLKEI